MDADKIIAKSKEYQQPECKVHGMTGGGLCGYLIVGNKKCGAPRDLECIHKK